MNNEEAKLHTSELWEKAKSFYLGTLHSESDRSQAERYFSMVSSVAFENGKFTIFTNNDFAADLIRKEYANKIKGSFLIAGADPSLEIEVKFDKSLKPVSEIPSYQRELYSTSSNNGEHSSARASSFVSTLPLKEEFTFDEFVKPLLPKVRPASAVERQVKVKLNGDSLLQVGQLTADVSRAGLLVDKSQKLGTGYLALNLCQNPEGLPLREMADKLCEKIRNVGFRNLPQGMSRLMSLPRAVDVAAVLLRMR